MQRVELRRDEKIILRRYWITLTIVSFMGALLGGIGGGITSFVLLNQSTSDNEIKASYNQRPRMIIGLSKIELRGGEIVGTQVDRVVRDIAWENSRYNINTPPDKTPSQLDDLVPYMEGARAREMMEWADAEILPLTPARAIYRQTDIEWPANPYYAADGKDNFSFLIEPSKLEYSTVHYVQEGSRESADLILPDTHGFNMVAEQAYRHKDQLYLVMACMDFESKAEAALYLAKHGLNIYAPCDRFTNILINYKEIHPDAAGTIIGSAPIRKTDFGAVIGDQPITVYLDETVVVQYTDRGYPDQYCDTAWRYFDQLVRAFNLEMEIIRVVANTGEAGKVIEVAEINKADVIGVRIYNEKDYKAVAAWLEKDVSHRAILFHSAAYEPGVNIFRQYPEQTTFGDLQPKIIE